MSEVRSEDLAAGAVHPAHDEVAAELASWYRRSTPALDLVVAAHWFGFLTLETVREKPRALLTINDPGEVDAALQALRELCGGVLPTVVVDDRRRHAALDSRLRDAGVAPSRATTHLALVGDVDDSRVTADVSLHDVGIAELEAWCVLKLQCFGNHETTPDQAALERELAIRGPEMAMAKLQLATVDDRPVGVLAFYSGNDQLVFNLGTTLSCRGQGIATSMLAQWAAAGRAQGCRSLVINATDPGRPQALYQSIGFVDEVYWYQQYEAAAETSASVARTLV